LGFAAIRDRAGRLSRILCTPELTAIRIVRAAFTFVSLEILAFLVMARNRVVLPHRPNRFLAESRFFA